MSRTQQSINEDVADIIAPYVDMFSDDRLLLAKEIIAKVQEQIAFEYLRDKEESHQQIRAKTIEQVLEAVEKERGWLGDPSTDFLIERINGVGDES